MTLVYDDKSTFINSFCQLGVLNNWQYNANIDEYLDKGFYCRKKGLVLIFQVIFEAFNKSRKIKNNDCIMAVFIVDTRK